MAAESGGLQTVMSGVEANNLEPNSFRRKWTNGSATLAPILSGVKIRGPVSVIITDDDGTVIADAEPPGQDGPGQNTWSLQRSRLTSEEVIALFRGSIGQHNLISVGVALATLGGDLFGLTGRTHSGVATGRQARTDPVTPFRADPSRYRDGGGRPLPRPDFHWRRRVMSGSRAFPTASCLYSRANAAPDLPSYTPWAHWTRPSPDTFHPRLSRGHRR